MPDADPDAAPQPATRPRRAALVVRAVAGVLALLLAVGAAALLYRTAPQVETVDAAERAPLLPVYRPVPIALQRPVDGYGTARARAVANLTARVTATVEAFGEGIDEGATVGAGDVLIRLDAEDFEAEVARLDAALAEAGAALAQLDTEEARLTERLELDRESVEIQRDELRRLGRIAEGDAVSARDLDQAKRSLLRERTALSNTQQAVDSLPARRAAAEAARDGLRAQRRRAERDLERTVLTSPIDGVLQTLSVEVGETVTAGQAVARVVDPQRLEVPLRLPAAARRMLRVDDPVRLHPTQEPDAQPIDSRLTRIAPEDDPGTRTLTAYAELDGTRAAPGTFLRGRVRTGDPTPRLVVPRRSIRQQRLQLALPVPELDDPALRRVSGVPVQVDFDVNQPLPETGLPDDQWSVLTDPLPEGALVIATASTTLQDNALIRVADDAGTDTDNNHEASAAP